MIIYKNHRPMATSLSESQQKNEGLDRERKLELVLFLSFFQKALDKEEKICSKAFVEKTRRQAHGQVIQDALGHADASTTLNIYTDATRDLKVSEFEAFEMYWT